MFLLVMRPYNLFVIYTIQQPVEVSREIEASATSVYGYIEQDPVPYIRHYDMKSFKNLIKGLHPSFTTFDCIRMIDLGGQLIGDSGLGTLVTALYRAPVEVLSLTRNKITDIGLIKSLGPSLRSWSRLSELYLNDNLFGDSGVEALFLLDQYSPTLKVLNIARNAFTAKSAQYIGAMFASSTSNNVIPSSSSGPSGPGAPGPGESNNNINQGGKDTNASADNNTNKEDHENKTPTLVLPAITRKCQLESVFAGGILSNRNGGEGDQFVRILCGNLLTPNARPIKKLDLPDMALSDCGGLRCLAALVSISPDLHSLNISRNAIRSHTTKTFYGLSLMMNHNLVNMTVGQCGLEQSDINTFELIKKKNIELRKLESIDSNARTETLVELTELGTNINDVGSNVKKNTKKKRKNYLTWEEQLIAGLMIAKEMSMNHYAKYHMNRELYNDWKAVKPLETPAHVVSIHDAYVSLMHDREEPSDPLINFLKGTAEKAIESQMNSPVATHPGSSESSRDLGSPSISRINTFDRSPSNIGSPPGSPFGVSPGHRGKPPAPADLQYLPSDIEKSLRASLLFHEYINNFLEMDRQRALKFLHILDAEEIKIAKEKLLTDEEEMYGTSENKKKKKKKIEDVKEIFHKNAEDSVSNAGLSRYSEDMVQVISGSLNSDVLGLNEDTLSKMPNLPKINRTGSDSSVGSTMSASTDFGGYNVFNTPGTIPVSMQGTHVAVWAELVNSYVKIETEAKELINIKKSVCGLAKVYMRSCIEKYIGSMKQRSKKARVTKGWAKGGRTTGITSDQVGMAIEDYHGCLFEYSTVIEISMAKIHRSFLMCIENKNPMETNASIGGNASSFSCNQGNPCGKPPILKMMASQKSGFLSTKSLSASGFGSMGKGLTAKKSGQSKRLRSLKAATKALANSNLALADNTYFHSLGLAGYFVSCVCYAIPREEARIVEAAKQALEYAKIDEALEQRKEAKKKAKATVFRKGPRNMCGGKNPASIPEQLQVAPLVSHKTRKIHAQPEKIENTSLLSKILSKFSKRMGLGLGTVSATSAPRLEILTDINPKEAPAEVAIDQRLPMTPPIGEVDILSTEHIAAPAGTDNPPVELSLDQNPPPKLDAPAHLSVDTNSIVSVHSDKSDVRDDIEGEGDEDDEINSGLDSTGNLFNSAAPPRSSVRSKHRNSDIDGVLDLTPGNRVIKSRYFKTPIVYDRPAAADAGSDSVEEIKFLCGESMGTIDAVLSRNNRRFLINAYPNTIWRDQFVTPEEDIIALSIITGNRFVCDSGAVAGTGTGSAKQHRMKSERLAVVSDVESRPGTSSSRPGTSKNTGSKATKSSSRSETSVDNNKSAPVSAPKSTFPNPSVYAEVECQRSEIVGNIERLHLQRLQVIHEQRKKLMLDARIQTYEELLK